MPHDQLDLPRRGSENGPRVPLTRAAIALGSNLGDRRGHLDWAIAQLTARLAGLRASSLIESAPAGVPDPQPDYLNGVVTGETDLPPDALMQLLLGLENARGRVRRGFRSPRTLDLDLILYGDLICNEAGLIVPHPHFRERRFVLEPLAEVAGDWTDPVTGQTVEELLSSLMK